VPSFKNNHRTVQIIAITKTSTNGFGKTSTAIGENIDTSPASTLHPPYTTDANLAGNNSYTI